jgi:type IV secretion system protein VirD4
VAASGNGEEVDFADWHRGTMTVFLCLAAPKFPVFNRWLRLVLTSALDEMTDRLDAPPLPVCFMLDELATLGHLETVENAVGLAAGYGVQLITVFQDVAQMRDLYKGRWASFIGNAGVCAVFSLHDYDTADYWSRFLGGQAVRTSSESYDIYGIARGGNTGEAEHPLVTPDQMMRRYSERLMLVLPQGSRPIEAERVPYFDDRRLDGLWDAPRGPVPAPVPATVPPAVPRAA